MKKLAVLAALAIGAFSFNPVEANAIGVDKPEMSEMSHWTQFRDSITGRRAREKERERERYYYGYRENYRNNYRHGHRPPPPPPHRRNDFDPPPRHRW